MQAKREVLARWWFIFWEESGNGPLAPSYFLSSNVIPQHLGGSKKC